MVVCLVVLSVSSVMDRSPVLHRVYGTAQLITAGMGSEQDGLGREK